MKPRDKGLITLALLMLGLWGCGGRISGAGATGVPSDGSVAVGLSNVLSGDAAPDTARLDGNPSSDGMDAGGDELAPSDQLYGEGGQPEAASSDDLPLCPCVTNTQ